MAILELPVRSDLPAYEFQVSLDSEVFTLRFAFNFREGRWSMDVADSVGTDIINGIKLVHGFPLLRQYVVEGQPPGEFILIDESGNKKNPGRDDLGNDVKLLYEEALA